MGVLDIFGGEKETTTTTTQQLPGHLKDAGEWLVDKAQSLPGYKPYGGEGVAKPNETWNTAGGMLKDYVTGWESMFPEAAEGIRTYMNADAQTIDPRYGSTPGYQLDNKLFNTPGFQLDESIFSSPAQSVDFHGVMDESSPIGSIDDYMNPFNEQVIQATLAKLYDTADRANLDLKRRATTAQSFGDARHGIEGALNTLNLNRAVGETAGSLNKAGYDSAIAQRQQDLARLFNTDVTNANFSEQQLARLLQGGVAQGQLDETALTRLLQSGVAQGNFDEQALQRLFQSDVAQGNFNEAALNRNLTGANALLQGQNMEQDMLLQNLAAMLGLGEAERGIDQAELDFAYNDWLRGQGWERDNLRTAASVISGAPYERTTEQVTTEPDNSGFQLLGSLAGAVAAPFTGGASLALPGIIGAGMTGGPAPAGADMSLPWLQ